MAAHFTKAIKTGQGSVTFYFNRIVSADGIRYHVSTVVPNNKAIIFHMVPHANKWVLADHKHIGWLAELEEDLSDTITKNILLSKKTETSGRS